MSKDIIDKIKKIIKVKVRPILIMDGGNIEFVDYKDKILSVKLLGSCQGCPLAGLTLKNTVKSIIKEEIPEIEEVEAIDFELSEENF